MPDHYHHGHIIVIIIIDVIIIIIIIIIIKLILISIFLSLSLRIFSLLEEYDNLCCSISAPIVRNEKYKITKLITLVALLSEPQLSEENRN